MTDNRAVRCSPVGYVRQQCRESLAERLAEQSPKSRRKVLGARKMFQRQVEVIGSWLVNDLLLHKATPTVQIWVEMSTSDRPSTSSSSDIQFGRTPR